MATPCSFLELHFLWHHLGEKDEEDEQEQQEEDETEEEQAENSQHLTIGLFFFCQISSESGTDIIAFS